MWQKTKILIDKITTDSGDPGQYYRIASLLIYAFLMTSIATAWGVWYLLAIEQVWLGAVFIGHALAETGVIGIALVKRRNYYFAAFASVCLALSATLLGAYFTGGLRMTNISNFFMIAVIAVALLGRRGFPIAVFGFCVALAFQIATWNGFIFPDYVAEPDRPMDAFLTWINACVVVLLFLWTSEAARKTTLRKMERSKRASEESEQRFRTLVNKLPDAVLIHDRQGNIKQVNPAFLDRLGFSETGHPPTTVQEITAPNFRTDTAHYLNHVRYDDATVFESAQLSCAGHTIPVEVSARYIELGGQPTILSVVRDLTERKRIEEERLRIEAQALNAQKLESLGVMAGGIAHDFNNLLTGILGNAGLLLEDVPKGTPIREIVEEVENAAKRASELSAQMLTYSGKGHFVTEKVCLNAVIKDLEELLRSTTSKKVSIKTALAEDLPLINADISQIRQVIINLMTNASEAMGNKEGKITITTSAQTLGNDELPESWIDNPLDEGLYVILKVSDHGCGMDPETLSKVFEPFFSTKFIGRGLGLSSVFGIVRGHKGQINIESEAGHGTTVKVIFPARLTPSDRPYHPSEYQRQLERGTTILVVDDEKIVLSASKRILERMAYKTLTAENGRQAIRVYTEYGNEIDCVLLDLSMPQMDGAETFVALKAINPDIKVILSSGYSEIEIEQKYTGTGFAGFLYKPYQASDLVSAIERAMGN